MHRRGIGPKRVYFWAQTPRRASKTSEMLFTGSWFGIWMVFCCLHKPQTTSSQTWDRNLKLNNLNLCSFQTFHPISRQLYYTNVCYRNNGTTESGALKEWIRSGGSVFMLTNYGLRRDEHIKSTAHQLKEVRCVDSRLWSAHGDGNSPWKRAFCLLR